MFAPKGKEKTTHEHVMKRIKQMQAARKETEKRWKWADRDVDLRPLGDATEYGKNFGNRRTKIGANNWQSDNSSGIAFQKIQIALTILIERNPSLKDLTPSKKIFKRSTPLMKALYDESVKRENLKMKIKRVILNQAKYGIAFAQTYGRFDLHPAQDLIGIDPDNGRPKYEDVLIEDFKGVWFEPLNNTDVWWDDQAKPFDMLSMDDWCRAVTYTKEKAEDVFGKSKNWKHVEAALSKRDPSENAGGEERNKKSERDDLIHGFLYESVSHDRMVVILNDIPVLNVPLPVHKRLSLSYAMWNLRNSETIDGVGIPEIIRQDKNLFDKVNNMSVDQLVLSIYKMFFYDGTLDTEDTEIRIRPGVGQSVIDPTKLTWMNVPGPGPEAQAEKETLKTSMDEESGITPTLSGAALTNKTAFEIEQVMNSAMRRLSTPLDGLRFMLKLDAKNRLDLIKLEYSTVDVEEVVDPEIIESYLSVTQENPELFKFDPDNAILYKYNFPELLLHLEEKDSELVSSKEQNFFVVTPEGVRWEGDIEPDIQPMLIKLPELERQQLLEFSNLIIPLLLGDPNINLKPVKQLSEAYEQDFKEWVPNAWLTETPAPEEDRTQPPEAETTSQGAPVSMAKTNNPGRLRTVVNKVGRLFTKINP